MPFRRSRSLLLLVFAPIVLAACSQDEATRPTATERPTIVAITPSDWSVVTGSVEVVVEATDAERVTLQFNNRVLVRSGPPFRFTWSTNDFPNGRQILGLLATNALGDVDTTVTLIADNPEWGVAIVAPIREWHVGPGKSVSLSAVVVGAVKRDVLWSVDEGTALPGSLGNVDAQGNYTAPPYITEPIVVRLIARSAADPGQFTDVFIHVEGISIQISPEMVGLPVGRTARLTARVFGTPDQSVTWSLDDDATHGTISSDGLFTAPSTLPEPPTARVRATSVADPTLSNTVLVQLTGPVTVAVSPLEATVVVGYSIQLTGSAQGAPDTSVEWFVEPPGSAYGRVTSGGYYLSPDYLPNPPIVQVWARSHFDTLSRAAVTITLIRPPRDVLVTVNPSAALVATGASRQFSATVENADDPAVVWSMTGAGTLSPTGLYTAPAIMPASATVVIRATSVADPRRGGTATVTIVPAADVATQQMIETLTQSGYRSAMISDQALNLVVTGLAQAAQLNGGVITTTGVVRRVGGGGLVYEPAAPGDRRLSFLGSGPRIDVTVDSLDADRVSYEFTSRLSGSNFVGYLACRLQVEGVLDLEIKTSGQENEASFGTDFDRSVRGLVVAQGKNWDLDIHHSGTYAESFHFGQTQHQVTGHVTVGGVLLTLGEQIDVGYGENCYVPGGGFYVGRSWQMANRADTGSEIWRIESDYRDIVDSNCGFYDRVQSPGEWRATGSLAIGTVLAGSLGFDGPVVSGTVPPRFIVGFFERAPQVVSLPRFREEMIPNPLLY